MCTRLPASVEIKGHSSLLRCCFPNGDKQCPSSTTSYPVTAISIAENSDEDKYDVAGIIEDQPSGQGE